METTNILSNLKKSIEDVLNKFDSELTDDEKVEMRKSIMILNNTNEENLNDDNDVFICLLMMQMKNMLPKLLNATQRHREKAQE